MNLKEVFTIDPLYKTYELSELEKDEIISILYCNDYGNKMKTLDSFCTQCSKDTTFIGEDKLDSQLADLLMKNGFFSRGSKNKEGLIKGLEEIGYFSRIFNCPRSNNDILHSHIFLFRVHNGRIIKIGQHPSIADLNKKEIKKYRKLKDNIYEELNRAIGLASHGVGVGSFVYLRRIIEKHILKPRLNKMIEDQIIKEEDINRIDFKSKISIAKDNLPEFLVNNTKLYSVLSKGIHELEEEECKQYFPLLRSSIEIILDQEIEDMERKKKYKELSDQLNKL